MLNLSPWRHDPLTGLENMLAFFERLSTYVGAPLDPPLSILYFDLVNFSHINNDQGREIGDQALRWLALALQDELPGGACFRLRGDEFGVVLEHCAPEEARQIANNVKDRFLRLTTDEQEIQIVSDPLNVAVIHFPEQSQLEIAETVIAMEAIMQQVKQRELRIAVANYPVRATADMRLTVASLIDRVLELGSMLDRAVSQAESDPLTSLPNSRAMSRYLREAIDSPELRQKDCALLLVDGDNLRAFNKISYAAGDEMIQQLARLLARGLREEDRLSRWRLGDEFLILLPDTDGYEALRVAQRLVQTVQESEWQLPVTISVGIALYPRHGRSVEELVDAVEFALNVAKEQGKNQAVLYTMSWKDETEFPAPGSNGGSPTEGALPMQEQEAGEGSPEKRNRYA